MNTLQDKVIFITGGSAGIGLECSKAYAEAGAFVIIASIVEEEVNAAIEILGKKHLGIKCDVTNAENVSHAIMTALKRFGRLDAIHNNAGIAYPAKPLHETTIEQWNNLFSTNLKSVLFTTQFGLEALKASKGCILNTSSLVAEIGQVNHAAYAATKGALNSLTKSMALDYAPYGIRVNAVAPAAVWTPMLRKWNAEQPDASKMQQYLNKIHPLGYCPEGDVVADACVFLLSEKARFITGTILPVTGGAELGYRAV